MKLKYDRKLLKRAANAVRFLSADAVQKAGSGHPGMPMGMADMAVLLWTHFITFNPEVPDWIARDRFVLSAGHGSMLLYSMLHLCGYDISLDDIKAFRQWESKTPGHPEYWCVPGVETTTGPLGQGLGNGVGMAIAAKMLAARFNTEDYKLFGEHFVFGIVSDGDLMEGVASEAASIAGHLKLGNIIYIYDDNKITIEGSTGLTFSEDVRGRFEAYGWQVLEVEAYDYDGVLEALSEAIQEKKKPSLLIARSHLAYGCPNKVDDPSAHGAPIGEEELKAAKKNAGWPEERFYIPPEVKELFARRVAEVKEEYKKWEGKFAEWKIKYPELAEEWNRFQRKEIPQNLDDELLNVVQGESNATRKLSGKVIQKLADLVPNFVGGSADLAPSNNTYMKGYDSISPGCFKGRNFHFGIREHGMGAILNGIALYGGFIPFGATFLVFSDYMRPSIRLAALMGIQVIYVFTHDSIFIGEDGPTHQPVEQLASLRLIPNLVVFRPADWFEVAMSWAYAIRRKDGPTAIVLTRQSVPNIEREREIDQEEFFRGAYVVCDSKKDVPDLVIVGTGSELPTAIEVRKLLITKGYDVRVVSIPSIDLFREQAEAYRRRIIPESRSKLIVIEAGVTHCWKGLSDLPTLVIGVDTFGKSAPYKVLAEKFGFESSRIAERVEAFVKGKDRGV